MRILVLTERYPPLYLGGYELACHAVSERLRKRGHEVRVLASRYGLETAREDGHVRRLLHYAQDSASPLELARWESADHRTFHRLMISFQPEVIYAWSLLHIFPSLLVDLGLLDIPVVLNIQDQWLPRQVENSRERSAMWLRPGANLAKNAAKMLVRVWLRRRVCGGLDSIRASDLPLAHLVFCSKYQMARHIDAGLPVGESRVIYNGLDTSSFAGEAHSGVRARGPLRVLFVGRLVAEKGAHTAIAALSILVRDRSRDVRLSIAGVPSHPFEYSHGLRALVAERGLHDQVRFLGMVAHERLPEVYRDHDVLVFPSRHLEGLPMTLLEAMSCGLAVVSTRTGGSDEILEEGENSLTFEPDDSKALAAKIERLADHPELVRDLGRSGQALARARFDVEKITDTTEAYLQHLIAVRTPRKNVVLGPC